MKILLSLLGIFYALSPYDLFPDFFVGVGWVDDLIVLGLLWWYLYVYRKRRYRYEGYDARGDQASHQETHQGFTEKTETPKDPYTILGVTKGASQEEIRKAYHRLAGQYHPDKVLHLGEEFRELAEIRFKEIQAAYDTVKAK
ncbi:MAG: DnaJ domain-containing protein [Desulfatiglandaceae bacterium]